MESIVVVFGLLVLGSVFIAPFVALGMASSANKRARQLELRLGMAEARAEWMERRANEIEQRLTAWVKYLSDPDTQTKSVAETETSPGGVAPTASSNGQAVLITSTPLPIADVPVTSTAAVAVETPVSPAPDLRAPPAPAARVTATDQHPKQAEPMPVPARVFADPSTPPVEPTESPYGASPPANPPYQYGAPTPTPNGEAPGFDWERVVGVRLFAWLGGAALFLAGALFLQFSIQRNLISPEVRVASGLLLGAVALFGGERLRARTPMAGNALCGAGVALLYAALFSAHTLYQLIGSVAAFGGMILVTVTAGLLAMRQNAYFVALLGLLGGMSTPYLLSTGQDRPVSLFAYVAALSLGVVYVSSRQRWPSLGLLGLLGATALFIGWSSRYLDAPRSAYALLATALIAGTYAVGRSRKREAAATGVEIALVIAAVLIPFVAALAIGVNHRLDLPPLALSVHLVAVSGLTWFVAKRDALPLSPVAAGLAVLTWVLRMDEALLQANEALAFAGAFVVPLAHFVAWLWHWRRDEQTSLTLALYVSAVGAAPVVFAARAAYTQGSFWSPCAYALGSALLLIGVALILQRGVALALSQLTLLASLGAMSWTDSRSLNETTAFGLIGSGLCFFVMPLVNPRLRSDAPAWIGASLALPLHFLVLYLCVSSEWERTVLGTLALASAALSVGMLAMTRRLSLAERMPARSLYALQGGGALAFITASIPILLSNEWLTVSWALEALAVCWLYRRVRERGLLVFALALAVGVGVRLLINPAIWSYHARSATPILNHYLYTFGVPIAALFLAAKLIQKEDAARALRLPAGFGLLATVLLFMLLNIEVADYFSTGDTLTFNWNGSGQLAEDMTYSLVWGAFGLGLLVAGLLLAKRAVRIGALGVLVLTIGKVFLHDLWELGALYRVGSIVGLAVALLGVSFLTQRFILPKESP